MANKSRFVAKKGLDNSGQTLVNVADPVNAQDASTKAFSSNASNLATGTILPALLPDSGIVPGTYNSIVVDAKGRVTAGAAGADPIMQVVTGAYGSFSGTNQIPISSAPSITSGMQVWSQSITLGLGTRVLLKAQAFGDHSVGNRFITLAYFRNTTLIGIASIDVTTSGVIGSISYMDYDAGLTPGATYTYSCRVGASNSGTWYLNQDKNGNKYGGGFTNSFSLTEII